MSREEYWDGDPYLAVCYREADTMRRTEKNEYNWLQGMYIYDAFGAIMSNLFAKKGTKARRYPDKPYRITPMTEAEIAEEREAERQKAIRSFNALKSAWDRKNA